MVEWANEVIKTLQARQMLEEERREMVVEDGIRQSNAEIIMPGR